jgi:hypothetical protein
MRQLRLVFCITPHPNLPLKGGGDSAQDGQNAEFDACCGVDDNIEDASATRPLPP